MSSSENISELEKRTIRKVTLRLLPFLFVCYMMASIDRINISFAASGGMLKDLGLSATQYGFAAGLFFISYFIFEIPSNMMVEKFGARKWIARIMITWGLIAASMAFVDRAWVLYVLRFVLGAAEAGFFPGVILYMAYWFPKSYRARMIAMFWIAVPISNGLGAAVSGWLLGFHGVLGLAGWRWILLLEGIPAILLSAFVLLLLTDKPKDAKWLRADERQWLSSILDSEHAKLASQQAATPSPWSILRSPQVVAITAIHFMNLVAAYNLSFFLPQIVQSMGNSDVTTGLLSSVPYFIAPFGLLVVGWSSDRSGERKWHCVASSLAATAGLLLAGTSEGWIALAGFALATAGIFGARPPLWAMPSEILTGMHAAVGIAYINAVGSLSGFVGPMITGWIKDTSGGFTLATYFTAAVAATSALLAVLYFPNPKGTSEPKGKPEMTAAGTAV